MDNRHSWVEVSLLLTDDAGITAVNRTCFGTDRPTDVISFSYDPLPGEPENVRTGEIIVNMERAMTEGDKRGGAGRELALYIAHGCDHLTGARDDTPAQRARMRQRETAWLDEVQHLCRFDGLMNRTAL